MKGPFYRCDRAKVSTLLSAYGGQRGWLACKLCETLIMGAMLGLFIVSVPWETSRANAASPEQERRPEHAPSQDSPKAADVPFIPPIWPPKYIAPPNAPAYVPPVGRPVYIPLREGTEEGRGPAERLPQRETER